MSLLRRGTETVVIFPEITTTDADGNQITKPSAVGSVSRAVIQPMSVGDVDGAGFSTVERLRMRLTDWAGLEIGAQAQVEWEGRRYAVEGEPRRYRGSARTAHVEYVLVRK